LHRLRRGRVSDSVARARAESLIGIDRNLLPPVVRRLAVPARSSEMHAANLGGLTRPGVSVTESEQTMKRRVRERPQAPASAAVLVRKARVAVARYREGAKTSQSTERKTGSCTSSTRGCALDCVWTTPTRVEEVRAQHWTAELQDNVLREGYRH
jgi:hypothetical protein